MQASVAKSKASKKLTAGTCITLPVESIIPDPRNEVTHPPRQIKRLKAALNLYGQQKPIVVTRDRVCLAGHGVLEAARSLGWTHIECKVSQLTGARAALYRFSDNWITRFARMDEEVMSANIRAIEEETGASFSADVLGLDKHELERLREGGEAWTGRRIDPDSIGDYSPDDETFVIKVERVETGDGAALLERINSALSNTAYEAKLC